MDDDPTELAIIGGGPAGAALACLAARDGIETTVFERSAGPNDKVCGDFLSGETAHYLARLGLSPAALGAVPLARVRLSSGRRTAETPLPFEAWSLPRRVLDEALLAAAARAGAAVLRGRHVRALERSGTAWAIRLDDGSVRHAAQAVLATGKHDLRGWQRPPGRHPGLVGLKWYGRLTPDASRLLGDAVELALFPGGYAGLQPVGEGRVNLCVAIEGSRLARPPARAGGIGAHEAWRTALAAAAGARRFARLLAGADLDRPDRPLTVAAIPYGHLLRGGAAGAPWRVGDQAAVIPSFCGDGVAIALHSAFRAHAALDRPDGFQDALAADLARPVGRATVASRLAVTAGGAASLGALAALAPSLLAAGARATRVPSRALL